MFIYTNDDARGVIEKFQENFDKASAEFSGTLGEMTSSNTEEVHSAFEKFNKVAILSIPEGVEGVQKVFPLVSVMGEESTMDYVSLVLRTSRVLENQLHETHRIVGGTPVADILALYKGFYSRVILESFIQENLKVLNLKVSDALKDAGVGYTVSFVSPLTDTKAPVVMSVTNDEIVFVATEKAVFSLKNIWLFNEDENLADVAKEAYDLLVDSFRTAERPIDLILNKNPLVKTMVAPNHSKPKTMVRKSLSRTIDGIKNSKNDVDAYFEKDGIVAIVRRYGGEYFTVFGPVKEDTFEIVENYDVIKNLGF